MAKHPDYIPPDPVGIIEIAARLGVKARTPHMWRHQRQLPPFDYESVNGTGAWEWSTILEWAAETGRLRSEKLRGEYVAMFGVDPPEARAAGPMPGSHAARSRASDASATRARRREPV